MTLKILLLQARGAGDPMARHEHECFVRASGLAADQIVTHDLVAGPPTLAEVRGYDALMVGGSGDYYISKGNLPHLELYLDLLREVVARDQPMFASCFGFHSLARAFGGEVIHDPEHTEVGTYELTRTPAALDDPLFAALPEQYLAQMGHKDRVARMPEEWPNYATSALCPLQATRVPGTRVWSSQFHPELDRAANAERYQAYLEGYAKVMSQAEIAAALERFAESPETSTLLARFLELVFG